MDKRCIPLPDAARARGIVVRFYAVGLLLFLVPWTRQLFIALIPCSLLLAAGFMLVFHRPWNRRTVLWFLFIVLSAFALEWTGVRTGRIFGSYRYGRGLAPLVEGTPLVIGINWLLVVYGAHAAAERLTQRASLRILYAVALMVAYDAAAEWAAPAMRMWSFAAGYPPLRNFVAWLIAGGCYLGGFEVLGIRTPNAPARFLFAAQWVFLLLIGAIGALSG